MTHDLVASVGIYGGALLVCFISGLVPIVNAELFLVGLSKLAVTSPSQLPAVALCAAAGQMSAKVIFYYVGLGVFDAPQGRLREKIDRARERMEKWQKRPYLVLATSATLGLPPLLLVSVAAGALRIGFRPFCIIGFLGRFARFGVICAIPWLA